MPSGRRVCGCPSRLCKCSTAYEGGQRIPQVSEDLLEAEAPEIRKAKMPAEMEIRADAFEEVKRTVWQKEIREGPRVVDVSKKGRKRGRPKKLLDDLGTGDKRLWELVTCSKKKSRLGRPKKVGPENLDAEKKAQELGAAAVTGTTRGHQKPHTCADTWTNHVAPKTSNGIFQETLEGPRLGSAEGQGGEGELPEDGVMPKHWSGNHRPGRPGATGIKATSAGLPPGKMQKGNREDKDRWEVVAREVQSLAATRTVSRVVAQQTTVVEQLPPGSKLLADHIKLEQDQMEGRALPVCRPELGEGASEGGRGGAIVVFGGGGRDGCTVGKGGAVGGSETALADPGRIDTYLTEQELAEEAPQRIHSEVVLRVGYFQNKTKVDLGQPLCIVEIGASSGQSLEEFKAVIWESLTEALLGEAGLGNHELEAVQGGRLVLKYVAEGGVKITLTQQTRVAWILATSKYLCAYPVSLGEQATLRILRDPDSKSGGT